MTVAVCADEVRWQVHSHRPSSRTLIVAGVWFPSSNYVLFLEEVNDLIPCHYHLHLRRDHGIKTK
jgi:hypothetical protein